MAHYLGQAIETPGAWVGAVVAVFLSAVTPTPQVGAAVLGLLVLCAFDALLAVAHAYREGRPITKQRAIDGAFKIGAYAVILIGLAIMRLSEPKADLGFQFAITICLGLFMATELLSIMSHVEAFGVRLPKKLIRALKGIEKEADKGSLAEEVKEN